MDLKHKLSAFFADKKQLLAVVLIFILGFAIRAHLMKYELMFGFDSYFHARVISYVIETFTVPAADPLAYYQLGEKAILPTTSWFFWYFCAVVYKLFTFGAPYNKELWIFFVKLLPAVFGALISVAMYFLGKEMYGKKSGVIMGVFAAVVPSFVYRTMSGFLEEDALGFLWLVLGFYFFIKALKKPAWTKDKIVDSVLAGVFFSIMAFTWEMFLLVPIVMLAFLVFNIPLMWFKRFESKQILDFVKLFAIAFIIFAVLATINDQGNWIHRSFEYVKNYTPVSLENVERLGSKGEGVLAQTVGEENTGIQFFGEKYNALILFPLIAFFLIPFRLLTNRKDNYSLLILFWLIITFVMAASKLKFTYTLGLPIAAAAGVIFAEAFNFIERSPGFEKKFLSLCLGFMILIGVGAGSFFVTTKMPNIETDNGWKEALYWIKENTPEDAKFFNWWDEGHWITFIGERGVIEDNRNYDLNADSDFGKFILVETENEALDLVNKYNSDYVIVDEETLIKQNSLAIYAYMTTDFSDPRLGRYYSQIMNCSKEVKPLTKETIYKCGNNTFDEKTMNAFPTQWSEMPTQVQEGRIPLFVYRKEDNSKFYIFNAASNKTFFVKLWFNEPSVKHFKKAYDNGKVRVYEIV